MDTLIGYVRSLNWVSVLIGILLGRFLISRFV